MKRFLILLTVLALLLTLPACKSGKPEIIDDPDLEVLEVFEKEDDDLELGVEQDDDWDDWEPTLPPESDFESASEPEQGTATAPVSTPEPEAVIDEDGTYTSKEEVALYLHTYGHLPSNFITKKEAQALGWEGGKLEPYAPGKSIGGDYFGNYEEQLPKKKGRKYYECDIDTQGKKSRGSKRIVWSTDGLIYYTGDHYETFELLYGEP